MNREGLGRENASIGGLLLCANLNLFVHGPVACVHVQYELMQEIEAV
jgi:hypothetical protein